MTEPENNSLTSLLEQADADLSPHSTHVVGQTIRRFAQRRKSIRRIRRVALALFVIATSVAFALNFGTDKTNLKVADSTFTNETPPQIGGLVLVRSKEDAILLAEVQALRQFRADLELQTELRVMKRRLAQLNRERAVRPVVNKYDVIERTNTNAYSMLLSATDALDGPVSSSTRPKLLLLIDTFPNTSAAEVATRLLAQK